MPESLVVRPYSAGDREAWNSFVATAKNSTFLFDRDYLEYHRERFTDVSLVVLDGSSLTAVLPANRLDDATVVSHGGLTYGGLIVGREQTLAEVLATFHAVLHWLADDGVTELLYKRIPAFYNTFPDDDLSYGLFLVGAQRHRVDIAAVVNLADRLPYDQRRRRALRKASRSGLRIVEGDFEAFWRDVLEPRLETRHGVRPVHTHAEIQLLADRFPDHIRQFSVHGDEGIVAGATIFETPTVAHAQYIGSTESGRASGALDHLFAWLIDDRYRDKRYFDLGTSNVGDDGSLNAGLLAWKEGFGARVVAHEFYRIETASHARLDAALAAIG